MRLPADIRATFLPGHDPGGSPSRAVLARSFSVTEIFEKEYRLQEVGKKYELLKSDL